MEENDRLTGAGRSIVHPDAVHLGSPEGHRERIMSKICHRICLPCRLPALAAERHHRFDAQPLNKSSYTARHASGNQSNMTPEQSRRYGRLVQAIAVQPAWETNRGMSADGAAKVIATAVTARKPRTRYSVGRGTAIGTLLARILPDRTLDRLLAAALRRHFPNESK